jgi:hypothetical protein
MGKYFVTAAPGYYGDASVVFSSHRTLEAALRRAWGGRAVYRGDKKKGDPWLRVYEPHHERIVALEKPGWGEPGGPDRWTR